MSRRRQERRQGKERRHARAAASRGEPRVVVREAGYVERLAYTRSQAAEALGVSRSTFNRRVLPYVQTVETPWGGRLIPVDELERLVTEGRRAAAAAARPPAAAGRKPSVPPDVVARIAAARATGASFRRIAVELNAAEISTAHGGVQWWPSTVRAVLHRASG
jgi:hypothetical protein